MRWSNEFKEKSYDHFARKWRVDIASLQKRNINAPRRYVVNKNLHNIFGAYTENQEQAFGIMMHFEPLINRFLSSYYNRFYTREPQIIEEYYAS